MTNPRWAKTKRHDETEWRGVSKVTVYGPFPSHRLLIPLLAF